MLLDYDLYLPLDRESRTSRKKSRCKEFHPNSGTFLVYPIYFLDYTIDYFSILQPALRSNWRRPFSPPKLAASTTKKVGFSAITVCTFAAQASRVG